MYVPILDDTINIMGSLMNKSNTIIYVVNTLETYNINEIISDILNHKTKHLAIFTFGSLEKNSDFH